MKRYWLFAGDNYYPAGGMSDLVGMFDTLTDCIENFPKRHDWWHIFDTKTGRRYNHYETTNDYRLKYWAKDPDSFDRNKYDYED